MKHYETKQNHNVLFKKNMLHIPRPFLRETHQIQKAGINCIQGSPVRLTCLTNGFNQSKRKAKKKPGSGCITPFFVFHTCLYLSCFNVYIFLVSIVSHVTLGQRQIVLHSNFMVLCFFHSHLAHVRCIVVQLSIDLPCVYVAFFSSLQMTVKQW